MSAARPFSNPCELKNPPFSKQFHLRPTQTLFIYTGSNMAWSRAKSERGHGTPSFSLVLPTGESPSGYLWPVAGQGVIVIDYGDPDPIKAKLFSLVLLEAKALGVIYIAAESNETWHYVSEGEDV